MKKEDLKNITIEQLLADFDISVRAANACIDYGFITLNDIFEYYINGNSFAHFDNIGAKTCRELEDLCKKYILKIANESELLKKTENLEIPNIETSPEETIILHLFLHNLSLVDKFAFEVKYNKIISKYSNRTMIIMRKIGYDNFVSNFLFSSDDILLKIQGCGKKTIEEILILKKIIKTTFLHLYYLQNETSKLRQIEVESLVKNDIKYAIENKLIDGNDIINHLTITQKVLIESVFNTYLKKYSNRTMNIFKAIGFDVLIRDYLLTNDNKLSKIQNLGQKSLPEAIDFKSKFTNEIIQMIASKDESLFNLKLNSFERIGEISLNDFASIYFETNNHFPMFWILEQFLRNDKYVGITTLVETGLIFNNYITNKFPNNNLSNDRIRQIWKYAYDKIFKITDDIIVLKETSKLIKYRKLLQKKEEWSYILDFINETHLVNIESSNLKNHLEKEECEFSIEFVFQIIANIFRNEFVLYGGIDKSKRDKTWKNTFLIRKNLTDIFDFNKFILEFNNHIENSFNLDEYLIYSDCWTTSINIENLSAIFGVVKDILLHEFQLNPNSDNLITISATKKRKTSDIVYEILKQNGQPIHIDDVFIEFKKILPEHKYTSPLELRPFLHKHDAISHRNRNSVFVLKEWEHVKSGTIRDTIIEFLAKKDAPQSVESVAEYVSQYFPVTKIKNIHSTMSSGKSFARFKGCLFGLENKEYPYEYKLVEECDFPKTFEQRLNDFENFIKENNHFPFSRSENKEEISLFVWWFRIIKEIQKITLEQKAEVNRINFVYSEYKVDKISFQWFYHLNDFKLFVIENRCLPSANGQEKLLYGWFYRAKKDFLNGNLSERQNQKYMELCKELEEMGIIIKKS